MRLLLPDHAPRVLVYRPDSLQPLLALEGAFARLRVAGATWRAHLRLSVGCRSPQWRTNTRVWPAQDSCWTAASGTSSMLTMKPERSSVQSRLADARDELLGRGDRLGGHVDDLD